MKHDPLWLCENRPNKFERFVKKRFGQLNGEEQEESEEEQVVKHEEKRRRRAAEKAEAKE